MYIFNCLSNSLQSAVECIFCRSSGTPRPDGEPLLADGEEVESNYNSVETLPMNPQEHRELTSGFKSWLESEKALQAAMFHVGIYFCISIVAFSFIFEDWPIYDSIYFGVVLFTTVGYGDLSPSNDPSRIFVVLFSLYGIIILGIFLGFLGGFIIEQNEANIERRLANARVKIMEQFDPNDTAMTPVEEKSFWQSFAAVCKAEVPIILVLIALGSPIVYFEGWDIIQGCYWMVVTGTTIGFGDLGPTHVATKCICIVWIPLAVAVFGEFLGQVANIYVDLRNDETEIKFMEKTMTMADLQHMDTDNDGKVSPNEFLQYMLVALQKVDKEDIDEIMALFKRLDRSNTGSIDKEDIIANYNFNVRPGLTLDGTSLGVTL